MFPTPLKSSLITRRSSGTTWGCPQTIPKGSLTTLTSLRTIHSGVGTSQRSLPTTQRSLLTTLSNSQEFVNDLPLIPSPTDFHSENLLVSLLKYLVSQKYSHLSSKLVLHTSFFSFQWVFLPEPTVRDQLILPSSMHIDYRAACFCHRRLVDIGFVCSVCLSSKTK